MKATMKTTLRSGFRSRTDLYEITVGASAPTIQHVDAAPCCTWTDDADCTHSVEVDGPAAVVWQSFSTHGSIESLQIDWIGIADEDIDAPITRPEGTTLYYVEQRLNTTQCKLIETVRDYLTALLEDREITSFSAKEWTAMPFHWGDQAAEKYWRMQDGRLETASGTGDNCPYITDAGEARYPSDDRAEEEWAQRELDEQLERDHGKWIRESYARNQNPLPGLRKKVGGKWLYRKADSNAQWPQGGCLLLKSGDYVIWIPE